MFLRQIVDETLSQYAYLIGCQATGEAIVIDPQRDVDRYYQIAQAHDLEIVAATETHIHADFLSGLREFAEDKKVHIFLSDEGGEEWRYPWAVEKAVSESRFQLVKHGEVFTIGNIHFEVLHTPGHTPEHICFVVTDKGGGADQPIGLISGDFIFVGDVGRPDLLETAAGQAGARRPSAEKLYASLQSFVELPDYLQVWPGHGAGSACGKALGSLPGTTVGYEKQFNRALRDAKKGEEVFVESILEGQPEPPDYFGRMKQLNRGGPTVLGGLPQPKRMDPAEFAALANEKEEYVVIDMRPDHRAFINGHLKGALYIPMDGSFPTVVGSYVEEGTPIYFLGREEEIEQAVRCCVRVGLDNLVGYLPTEHLQDVVLAGGEMVATKRSTMAELEELRQEKDTLVLDVRRATEFFQGSVPHAINIAHTSLRGRRAEIPQGKTLLVHCLSGFRSVMAAALLERLGYPVHYIDGHFMDWMQSVAPELAVKE